VDLEPPLERFASDRERIFSALGERLTARTVGKLDEGLSSLFHDSRDVFQFSPSPGFFQSSNYLPRRHSPRTSVER
jgi:hypothetical protein